MPKLRLRSSVLGVQIAILAIGYFVLARLGHTLASLSPGIVVAWPAIGFAVAVLVFFGWRAWPGIAIGGLVARLSVESSAVEAVGWTVAGTVAPLAAAWLLERHGFNTAMTRLRDVLAVIILGGAVSCFLGAVIAAAVVAATGDLSRGHPVVFGLSWWQTDLMGVVLVAPLLLALGTAARSRASPFAHRGVEMLVLTISGVIAAYVLFGFTLPVIFLVFPFALWAALRLSVSGAATVNVLMAGIAVWAAIAERGPFSQLPPTQSLIVLQSFSASVAVTSLVLAAITAEREQATEDARASRARIVEAADAERRRVERNLHDGAQQRLVSLSLLLRLAQMRLGAAPNPALQAALSQAADELHLALTELRELARGLHPAILTHEGLGAAVQSLVEQAPLPVTATVPVERFSAAIETTAYFVVCEALVNTAKYAQAAAATVDINHVGGRLVVDVADDGIGGADPDKGSGLGGLSDRVAALGGRLHVSSPSGKGTRVRAELPCA